MSISILNKPKFSEFEAHKTLNERREKLIPLIEEFISGHRLFKDKEVQVSYMQKGVGSIVCLIESADGKYILKVPLSLNFAEGESEFLEKWASIGVKTPKIFETGTIGDHHYLVMEFIDEPTLLDKYSEEQLLEMEVFVDLGKTLRRMHEPKAEGFGRVANGKAEFDSFNEWISSEEI
ncbi:MAG: fructosamine kinase family protein [Candidatus Taylorbacteria bacterium]